MSVLAVSPLGERRELVIGVSPCGEPQARLVAAVGRAGGVGVLDLGIGDRRAVAALQQCRSWSAGPFGVRIAAGCALRPADLPPEVDTVLLAAGCGEWLAELSPQHRALVEVNDVEEARQAAGQGAHGLIARGHEAAGRVGELSSFVLLQRLLSEPELDLPVWVCGGIGLHTAAAAVLGGAAGVVLDSQLALLAESDLPEAVRTVIAAMDGSETVLRSGYRVLRNGPARSLEKGLETAPGARLETPSGKAYSTLPVGQDGFLAHRFAERWTTAAGVVRAVRESIVDALTADPVAATLRPGSRLAQCLGVALPVVQGPMTRVSDQPRFAAAVAEQGALPVIALALAGREHTRTLLQHTQAALGQRPWGVGVLGFAPEQTRAAQLEVIRELRPSCAIIAGGRPSQAATLEQVGIATFLHVPSPGLLDQFLAAGARKFVFEGSECGGHVGPRSSFTLWEAQLAVLTDYLDAHPGVASDIQVLFAGGIHDARSAAMVAALAAPLTRRGAGIGVLMGTAYLFTTEAVDCGAIQPVFQHQVLQAQRTELLVTSPGHATRCVATPFTEHFLAVRDELRARQLPERQIWAELELLNVGRLRIASKGIQRRGSELVTVDEAEQLTEGLFMAGQVAVLRSATTTIAALHSSVTSQAADFLAARREELGYPRSAVKVEEREPAAPPPLDIAIVGLAGMFPDAPDLTRFWANIVTGADAISEVPSHRWDPQLYYSAGATGQTAGQQTPSKWGGFLPRIAFDPLPYGIPPAALGSIEPVQLLALEVARRALQDAGYGNRKFDRSRVAVVFGAEAGSDLHYATALRAVLPSYLGKLPDELAGQLPQLTEDSFPGMLANLVTGRIANRLDLGGANYTVDAACASSLAALDVAGKELASQTSDMVLCGGADLHNSIYDYLLFSSVHALSPTGRCRTFDSSADGIVLGEGVACVVLKRLADAERDGDRIYAVIKGIGSASDGRSLGLTAPRPEGQRRALQRAYRNAGISPAEVGLLEAHGTGTVVGDRTELTTLTGVFTEAGAAPGSCALGSVKSQIGHTKCAAGLAGLIKAALSLHTGVRPPTLHVTQPNPAWQVASSPFSLSPAARPWAAPPAERIAGVSAFGFGGIDFHVVLQGYDAGPPPRHSLDEWPAELFTFRGRDPRAAEPSLTELLELTTANDAAARPWRLRDLARIVSHQSDRSEEPVQVALVATDLDELADLLRRALQRDSATGLFLADPGPGLLAGPATASGGEHRGGEHRGGEQGSDSTGKVAVLFPGQGSQHPGMLAELFVAFPELHHFLQLGRRWADTIFPPAAYDRDALAEQHARLRDTRAAQPALGIAGLAVYHLLTQLGVQPDMLAGHSYGELVALSAAGAADPATLLTLSAARAEVLLAAAGADPGTMAAVPAPATEVERVLQEAGLGRRVVLANHNSPRQVVISGPTTLVEQARRELKAAGYGSKLIPVACAFHSPVVAGAATRFAEILADHPLRDLELPVWSNRTAARYPEQADAVRAELAAQLAAPVRFAEQIESMYAAGARIFIEAGPGTVLSGLVQATLGDRPHLTVCCESPAGQGLRGFLGALAQLAVAGVRLRTGWLFHGRDAVDVSDTAPPPPPGWTVDGQLVRTREGDCVPGGLTPARRVDDAVQRVTGGNGTGRIHPETAREALLNEFLRTSRDIVAAQRDVLLAHFGAEPTGGSVPAPVPQPALQPEQPDTAARATAPIPASPNTPATPPVPAIPPAAQPPPPTIDPLTMVRQVISERTGYPIDLLEPELDLEADLSIDSIKRTEIAGELAARFATNGSKTSRLTDVELEELVQARTAAAIAEWLSQRQHSSRPPQRFILEYEPVSGGSADGSVLDGAHFVIFGGGRVSAELATQLRHHGASVRTVGEARILSVADGPVNGVVYLDSLAPTGQPLLPDVFPIFQAALARSARWLLAACLVDACPVDPRTASPPGHAFGLAGMFRTVAREYPNIHATLVEIDPAAAVPAIAHLLVQELLADQHPPVVRYLDGTRQAPVLVEAPLGTAPGSAQSAPDTAAEAAVIGLDSDSVLVLFGGARGITAHLAAMLARATGCRIELIGRTPLPAEPEHPSIAAASDRPALRAALARLGSPAPAEVERTVSRILAQREIQASLARLQGWASCVRYHCVDVCDEDAVHRLVKELYAEHGRLDGVVYAAGVIADRLLSGKDLPSFRRVFSTKVDGARALLDAVAGLPEGPRFVVLFGSIAAVLGSRGQVDYAAANDALDSLAATWSARTGQRSLTVHWGPWEPDAEHPGMVTPELQQEYRRRGIALLDPQAATRSVLQELAWGEVSRRTVVYTAPGFPVTRTSGS